MKKYKNGEYVELSQEEIELIRKDQIEHVEESAYAEAENNTENTIKETASGKAIVLKDISPTTGSLIIKIKGSNRVSGKVAYMTGQNIWDEKCEYSSSGLYLYSKNYVHVIPETQYYLYCDSPIFEWEENVELFTEITYYGIANEELSKEYNVKRNSIITTPPDCFYIKFKLNEFYGDTYQNDICINVSDERINGTYEAFKKEHAYESNKNGDITITKPDYPVITLFTEEEKIFLECEYEKSIAKVLAGKQDRQSWEKIASGKLTEEVSALAIDGFTCSKLSMTIAVASSENNSAESYMQIRTNKNSNAGGGTDTASLSQIFRTTGSATKAYVELEMKNKRITGVLFSSAGTKANYMNTSAEYDSITGIYLQPVNSDAVFGIGTTYELWGVRE